MPPIARARSGPRIPTGCPIAGWEQARGVGRRLEGSDLELIVCSDMRRARETAEGIADVLELPIEVDPELREVQQSDAFHAASPDFGTTANLNWMPSAPPDHAEPGAESFNDIVGRVHAIQERLAERAAAQRFVAVSHFNFLHFFLGAPLFGDDFSPSTSCPSSTRPRQHGDLDLRAPPAACSMRSSSTAGA
jgi:probable phosphoglycerate mutase